MLSLLTRNSLQWVTAKLPTRPTSVLRETTALGSVSSGWTPCDHKQKPQRTKSQQSLPHKVQGQWSLLLWHQPYSPFNKYCGGDIALITTQDIGAHISLWTRPIVRSQSWETLSILAKRANEHQVLISRNLWDTAFPKICSQENPPSPSKFETPKA